MTDKPIDQPRAAAAATVASLAGGHLADRVRPRHVFAASGVVYVAGYILFAVNGHEWESLLVAFLVAGVGIGLAETAESTIVARGLPPRLRSSGFGMLGLTQSLGDLIATLVVGVLWSTVSATVAFCYAAGWMVLSVLAGIFVRPR